MLYTLYCMPHTEYLHPHCHYLWHHCCMSSLAEISKFGVQNPRPEQTGINHCRFRKRWFRQPLLTHLSLNSCLPLCILLAIAHVTGHVGPCHAMWHVTVNHSRMYQYIIMLNLRIDDCAFGGAWVAWLPADGDRREVAAKGPQGCGGAAHAIAIL